MTAFLSEVVDVDRTVAIKVCEESGVGRGSIGKVGKQ